MKAMHPLCIPLLQLICLSAPLQAATFTWSGGVPSSPSANFSEPANWSGSAVPPAGEKSTRLVFGAVSGSGRVQPNHNLGNNFILNELAFTAAAPSFQLNGQSLIFVDDGTGVLPGLVSDSAQTQTFNLPLSFNTRTRLRGSGAGELRFPAPWQNNGRVEILHPSVSLLADNAGYSGTLTLGTAATPVATGSTLRLGHARALGTGQFEAFPNHTIHNAAAGPLTFGNAAIFNAYANGSTGPITFTGAQPMTFAGSAIVSTGNSLYVAAPSVSLTGTYNVGASVAKSGPGDLILGGTALLPATGTTLTVLDGRVMLAGSAALNERQAIYLNGLTELTTDAAVADAARLGALRGETTSRVRIARRPLRLQRTAFHADNTFHGRFAPADDGGALFLEGEPTALTTFTNGETVTIGSGANLRQTPASQVSQLSLGSTRLDLAAGAKLRAQFPDGQTERPYHTSLYISPRGQLNLGTDTWLLTTNEVRLQSGSAVTLRGANALWQHQNDSSTPFSSLIYLGTQSPSSSDPAVLTVAGGARVETDSLYLGIDGTTGHLKLQSGASMCVANELNAYDPSQKIEVDAATLEVGLLNYAGELAVGNSGEVTLQAHPYPIRQITTVFADLPQQSTPGTIKFEKTYILDADSTFSGIIKLHQSLILDRSTALRAATVELTRAVASNDLIVSPSQSDAGIEVGALAGTGTLNHFAWKAGPLVLGGGHRDATFSGRLQINGSIVRKVGTGTQTFARGIGVCDGVQVQGGRLVLAQSESSPPDFITSHTTSPVIAPYTVGQSPAVAQLEIQVGREAGMPGSVGAPVPASLVSGVAGTSVLVAGSPASPAPATEWRCFSGLVIGYVPDRPRAAWRHGLVTVRDHATLLELPLLRVGAEGGDGELRVENRSLVLTDQMEIGALPAEGHASTGTIRVSGGSALLAQTVTLGPPAASPSTTVALTVESGGNFEARTALHFRHGSPTFTINGGTATLSGLTTAGGDAAIELTDPATPGTPALTVSPASAPASFHGFIGGSGSLRKNGAQSLTLGGELDYNGSTEVQEGTLILDAMLDGSSPILISGGELQPRGHTVGRADGQITVGPGGQWAGGANARGNWRNAGLVTLGAGETLTLTGSAENAATGVIRVTGGGLLNPTGTFINRGVIDVITGRFEPPPGFINEGIILDASSVRISAINRTGSSVQVSILSHDGHTYRLQKSPTLSGAAFTDIGSAQTGANGVKLTFADPAATSARAYYRIRVE